MSGIFQAISDFFSMIFDIINFIFKAVVMLFSLLANGLSLLFALVRLLPLPFVGGAIALVIVCVLYKVLGRENQS